MAAQSGLQSRQQRQTLFVQSRQIAANPTKCLSSLSTAEAPGDLLLGFYHPKITFGEIIIKIHTKILQEAEDGLLVFAQTVEQIACGALFDASTGSGRGGRSRGDLIAAVQQAEKRSFPIQDFPRIEPELSYATRLFGRFLHIERRAVCHQQVSGARASHPGLVSSKARGARDAHAHRVAEPLTKNSMALLFARLSQRAGLTAKPIHPSMLRDTYAIWFLQTGGNLPTLQEQLGLADPASVRRYQRFCDEQQRAEAGTQTGSEGPMTRPKPSPPPSRLLPN